MTSDPVVILSRKDGEGSRPQRSFTSLRMTSLAVILGVACFLRLEHLGQPSYWLDEVLSDIGVSQALTRPWWRWVTGFDAEHGPLSFAVQLATRIAGRDEFAGRLGAALFGIATIPLIAFFRVPLSPLAGRGWREAPGEGSLIAAALLAISPLHVYYSREARPYALLMVLTAALLVALLRESHWFYVVLIALLYTSAVAAPVVAAAAVAAFVVRRNRFGIAASLTTLAFPLLYRGGPASHPDAPFPTLDVNFFVRLIKGLTVSALGADIEGRTTIVLCAFAIAGAIALVRRDRGSGLAIISMTVLPVVFAIASLKLFNHWFALRYVCTALIGFLVLAGAGIVFVTRIPAIAMLLTIGIGWQVWPAARRECYQKLDWRRVAATLARYSRPGDLILAAEPASGIVLPWYLAPHHRERDVIQMSIVPLASRMIHEHPATWLVSVGAGGAMRDWMCRYPIVLASELDGFRMHYASPTGDFLRERAQAPEMRAVSAAMGSRFQVDLTDDRWMREGWAAPEDGFRWAVGKSASIVIPQWGLRDRIVRVNVLPMSHSSLPPQTMRVMVNGKAIAGVTLANRWAGHSFNAPAGVWINGLNAISFSFGYARAPASVDSASRDERPLAMDFDRIEISDANGKGIPRPGAVRVAIASAFIDELTAWRDTPRRLPSENLNHDAVSALIGRLGFDPETTWPRLERNEIDLDDLCASLAAGSDCEEDRAFLTRVYRVLFQRQLTDPEMRSLLAKLHRGDSRATVVRHLMKSPELRAAVLGR